MSRTRMLENRIGSRVGVPSVPESGKTWVSKRDTHDVPAGVNCVPVKKTRALASALNPVIGPTVPRRPGALAAIGRDRLKSSVPAGELSLVDSASSRTAAITKGGVWLNGGELP